MVPAKIGPALAEVFDKTSINPYLIGERGMGKTSVYELVRQHWAKKLLDRGDIDDESDVELRYIYTAQMADGGDLLGLPDKRDGITFFARNEQFPTDEDVALGRAKPYGILVFDEPNRGTRETIQALFQILVSKELGPHTLAKNWRVGLAGNPDTGEYIVNTMDEAFWDRVMLLRFENSPSDWVRYARAKQLNSELVGFVEMHGSEGIRKALGGENFKLPVKPSYRSMEQAATLLSNCTFDNEAVLEECLQGLLGVDTTVAFMAYRKNNKRRPLEPMEILTGWKKSKAAWMKIIENGDTDLRNATTDALLAFLGQHGNDADKFVSGEWSVQALYEALDALPRDVLMSVMQELVKLSQGDDGNDLLQWFLTDDASIGRRLLLSIIQRSPVSVQGA